MGAPLRGRAWVQSTPRRASTSFWLVLIHRPLNPLSGRFGSTPSEFIARKTCFAESPDSRLQPQAATHPPGTMIHRNNKSWREVRLLFPASRHVPRSVAVLLHRYPIYRWRPDHPVDLRGRVSAHDPYVQLPITNESDYIPRQASCQQLLLVIFIPSAYEMLDLMIPPVTNLDCSHSARFTDRV